MKYKTNKGVVNKTFRLGFNKMNGSTSRTLSTRAKGPACPAAISGLALTKHPKKITNVFPKLREKITLKQLVRLSD